MTFRANFIFFFSLLRTSIRASMGNRNAFLLETCLMLLNNLVFLSLWWIFFLQFKSIDGWQMNDMTILMMIVTGAYGLTKICFGGVKLISRSIVNGDLDPFMTQPKNLLFHLTGSKSYSKGWGHLFTSLTLACLGGIQTYYDLPIILVSILCGSLVFTAFGIMAHSLAFWLGPIQSVSQQYCNSLFVFALYPTNIYSGVLQLIMFTLIPAGVIGYLPVELLRKFSWIQLFTLVASSFIFFGIAFSIFYWGLKKYESGNIFGVRL